MPRFYFDIENAARTTDLVGEEHDDNEVAIRAGMVILAEVALDEAHQGRPTYVISVKIRDEHHAIGEVTCRFWQTPHTPT